jgi:ArsR family transcriptional regulator, arsenate/arsenite/antimonite-responsive transcriptional repressor
MNQITKFFKALSEPPRLRIVSLLTCRSLCVTDLQRVLDASQPFVSRHLAFLRDAGLVVRTRRNGVDLYELNQSDTVTHPFVTIVIELQVERPALQADREMLKQLEAQGGLRADRSRIETEESPGSEPAGNGEELFDSVPVGIGSTP